jgi:hypothetical protein
MLKTLNSGFSQLSDDGFYTKASQIIAALDGNVYFLVTDPTHAALLLLLEALHQAMQQAPGGVTTAEIRVARENMENALERLAMNLELVPDVTDVMLATTGFDLAKDTQHTSQAPAVVTNLLLKPTGNTGEVQFIFGASEGARGYEVEWTEDPNAGPWQGRESFSSTRKVILNNLPRKHDVWGRVRAMGANNTKSPWSDPATMLVQ